MRGPERRGNDNGEVQTRMNTTLMKIEADDRVGSCDAFETTIL